MILAILTSVVVALIFFFVLIRPQVRQLRQYEAEIKRISAETDKIYERLMRR